MTTEDPQGVTNAPTRTPPSSAATGSAADGTRIALSAQGVTKRFDAHGNQESTLALAEVDLEIEDGKICVLLGPSGCGKTTLLRILAGLEVPTAGVVRRYGQEVTGPSRDVAMMFQSSVLLPWRSVLKNILLPAEIVGNAGPEVTRRALELLAAAGLEDAANHTPASLSGGMRQRVALCRALITDPRVLFMDEPFGALDAITRTTMTAELYRVWRSTSKTIVFVTHDIAEAVRLGSEIVLMDKRPGRVVSTTNLALPTGDYGERARDPRVGEYVRRFETELGAL